MLDKFLRKVENRDFEACVVGLGYVGLPLLMRLAEVGVRTCGFDVDEKKVRSLREGISYIRHIPSERIVGAIETGLVRFSSQASVLSQVDAVLICVPTPLKEDHTPEMRFVESTAEMVAAHLREGQLIVLESTTYPGTTREVLKPRLERAGLVADEDFFLAYCPEREDPGNPRHPIGRIPRVAGGIGPNSLKAAAALYRLIVPEVIEVSSCEAAEASKLLENVYRAVNIALVNELKIIFEPMGIDVWEVIRASSTKPFGFQPFYPGPGWGGHCIPVDPFYLSWRARQVGEEARFIEDAGMVNTRMPQYVVKRTQEALSRGGKSLTGAKVLVLGLAYKKNVDDDRESPVYEIIDLLISGGAEVSCHDPYLKGVKPGRRHPDLVVPSVGLTAQALAAQDAVIIVTDHDCFDRGLIAEYASLVVDTRNFMDGVPMKGRLVKA